MGDYYILDENRELVEADPMTWGQWCENIDNRRVEMTEINNYEISTVFLGINHNWSSEGAPLLYETMVFSPKGDDCYMTRHATWDEAVIGHKIACEWVKNGAAQE